MKRKIIITVSILVALATSLSAQVTRKQADSIVLKHLQNEMIPYDLLYVHVNMPNEEGIPITTSNHETFRAKYACWAYYVDESESVRRRYFFVKENNGSLLEVVANNDLVPGDWRQWIPVETVGLVEKDENNIQLLYPNPTNGQWTIDYGQLEIENVEVFDVLGKMQKVTNNKEGGKITIDTSHLPAGIYLLKIKTGNGIITQKGIKN
jgi:hypothetical protein